MAQATRELAKTYEPQLVERDWYERWDEAGTFTPPPGVGKEDDPFFIIMPPPNVTGELHIGHALIDTVEDILIRWHRMLGDPTLWLPGVDHAGIATQGVVEKELAKEGLTRHDLGREEFVERVWDWVDRYRDRIREQHPHASAPPPTGRAEPSRWMRARRAPCAPPSSSSTTRG